MTNVIQEIFENILSRSEEELEEWGITVKTIQSPDKKQLENDFYQSLDAEQRRAYGEVESFSNYINLCECYQRFEQGFRIGFYLAQQLNSKMNH